jgi:hypothetical protein
MFTYHNIGAGKAARAVRLGLGSLLCAAWVAAGWQLAGGWLATAWLACAGGLLAAGCTPPAAPLDPGAEPGVTASPVAFARHTVAPDGVGPAFVTVADVDADGRLDLVVSGLGLAAGFPHVLGEGAVTLYRRGASLDDWSATPIAPSLRFPNRTTVADVDGDGDLDVIVPSGFLICPVFNLGDCGGLGWYEQTAAGFVPHRLVDGAPLFYHSVQHVDFDGDGVRDLITVGESRVTGAPDRAELHLYRGRADGDRFAAAPDVLASGLGSFPTVRDLDGDGDLDVASAEFFASPGSFVWLERTAASTLARHVLDGEDGPSIQLSFAEDLFGDGRRIAVGANHVNQQKSPPDPVGPSVFALWPTSDLAQPWHKAPISQGIALAPGSTSAGTAAPGIFGLGDIDGDGDTDVLVSGDGDPRVYWLEQVRPGRFATHVLEASLTQAGGMVVADLDGDGKNELVVTGYDANVVYVYSREAP